ncbi:GTP 3',8-cyclase MoaA [Pseudenhygromyxa sp. WMMC2535]|nr:GTP 3',8-cyclase MoaA [Pseudenhygromyxa sp. WMMC2535]
MVDPVDPGEARLVDRHAREVRYLRVSLTDRCSMRCTYCMPPQGVEHVPRSEVLSLEEVVEVVAAFARWGVARVRLTGGEPTLRRDLPWLIERLARLQVGETGRALQVVMTTNGERLEALARPLRAAGLSGLSVSLDSLDPERFAAITRRDRLTRVVKGIEAAAEAGFGLKINTVAVRGFNDDELAQLCSFAWERGATPRFIELMPMAGGQLFVPGELMPAAEIRAALAKHFDTELDAEGRPDAPVGPAHYWRSTRGRSAGRRVGIIAAMTENFCASCNRLRVSATGQLHACLARDEAGDLRGALRSGRPGALAAAVAAALGEKRERHAFELDGAGGPRKAMISIGG